MLSTFNVTNTPTIMVHQYDVSARRTPTRMAKRQPSCLTPSPSLQLSEQQTILVMCHTRELAGFQIRNEYNRFAKFMPDVRVGVFPGLYILELSPTCQLVRERRIRIVLQHGRAHIRSSRCTRHGFRCHRSLRTLYLFINLFCFLRHRLARLAQCGKRVRDVHAAQCVSSAVGTSYPLDAGHISTRRVSDGSIWRCQERWCSSSCPEACQIPR